MTFDTCIAFALGGNVGNKKDNLNMAIANLCKLSHLDETSLIKSSIIETAALLPENAPIKWNMSYLNQVIIINSDNDYILKPEILLQDIKQIETSMGRQQNHLHWSPRIIDIDIIAIENFNYNSAILQIPHKLAHQRKFVLKPLCEVWENAMLANELTAKDNLQCLIQN